MRDHDHCYFCDERITATKNVRVLENHTRVCRALREFLSLINPLHLEDSGALPEEIDALPFPGKTRYLTGMDWLIGKPE